MRKLPGLVIASIAVGLLASVNVALATPPSGQFSATDHGRAQQTANATLTIPPADHVSANYTITPGGDTGWRTGTGDSVIAVFKGTLAVEQAQECAGEDVAAGKAVVIPAGKFRLHNTGNQPAELSGLFFNLPAGGPNPLVDGTPEPAPACAGFSATAVNPGGVSAADLARGATGTYDHLHGQSSSGVGGTDRSATVVHKLEAGKDLFVVTYKFEPGSSTGWLVHTDEMAIEMQGTVSIWEGRDGECKKVEEYSPGQAWAHKPHRHMATNDGKEPAVFRIIGFNLKHGDPLPLIGSSPDHVDFTQAPPADCPRLR